MIAASMSVRAQVSPWTRHLLALGLAWAGLLAIRAEDTAGMARIWWTSSTYAHCLLIPVILAWLVSERRDALRAVDPTIWPAALAVPFLGAFALLLGEAAGVATLRHLGLVAMLAGAVPVLLGRPATRLLAFPLAYSLFLVPAGEELVPALQLLTARMCMALLGLVGIPAHLEGVFITVSYGWFEVAEACSGARFLVAMAALAVLVAHLCFRSWTRRIAFVAFALAACLLANGLRAFGTIWLARGAGVEAATGVDHLVYGWFFFAAVIALILALAIPFFDRRPGEPILVPHPGGGGRQGTFPVAPTAALLLAGALPGLWLVPSASSRPVDADLPAVPGWTRAESTDATPGTPWTPRFAGADAFSHANYRHSSGATVDVVFTAYASQEDGRELVGYGQGVDPDWSWNGAGAPVAGGRADRYTTGGQGREVLTFLRMGDVTTGDAAAIKWETVKARLLWRPAAGRALLVSAANPGPAAASRPAIDRFLRDAGGAHALLSR